MTETNDQEWPIVRLGQVADIVMGQAPAGKDCNKLGQGTPFVKTAEFGEYRPTIREWTTDPKRFAQATDVLISVVGATCGKINLGADCAIGRSVAALRPNPKKLIQFYLYLFMEGQVERLRSGSQGAAQTVISKEMLASTVLPLPPLEEQRRIVAVLDEAFEVLNRAHDHVVSNLHNTQELYASLLSKMVNCTSENWVRMLVSDTFTRVRVPNKIKRRDYLASGEFPIVSQESGFINGYWNNAEDVISIERPVVIFGDHTRCFKFVDFDFVVGADGTQILSPIDSIEPEFYYYALQGVPIEGKGYARHFIHLKKGEIVFPVNLTEQRNIASTMRDIEAHVTALSKEYEAKLADIDDFRQSVLQRAFAGELT